MTKCEDCSNEAEKGSRLCVSCQAIPPIVGWSSEEHKYTLEAGRWIYRNGEPFFALLKGENASPHEVDRMARAIAEWLGAPPPEGNSWKEYNNG